MSGVTFERLEAIHPKNVFPCINITPVLWHNGDFCGIERLEVRWPDELRTFVDESRFEQMKARLEECKDLIKWLASEFVTEGELDEVCDQMARLGIGLIGADDV